MVHSQRMLDFNKRARPRPVAGSQVQAALDGQEAATPQAAWWGK